jgi:hypothetical protein
MDGKPSNAKTRLRFENVKREQDGGSLSLFSPTWNLYESSLRNLDQSANVGG